MRDRHRGPDFTTLQRKGRWPVWVSISWRALFVVGLIGLAIAVHWLERDGLKDSADGQISFVDVVYFTMISITTTGYGDIVPVSERARLFDAIVVTPIRVFAVLVFLGTAYSFVFRRTWDRWRMAYIQRNLHDHIVIAGFGTTGSEAVEELIARGAKPGNIVVIDCDTQVLEQAKALGCAVMEGDATRDKALQAVGIERARALVVSAGSDDTSILITLTARHLVPNLTISVAVRNEDNELLARQAGATTVINPVSFAGLLLAGSTHGEHIADYIADLASSSGRVRLSERTITDEECGKPLSALAKGLGVRVYRAGKPYGFWEPEAQSLLPGDCIVEILPTSAREAELS
ncbi:MAG TPA: potassium channel family protein [Allosphingosinicella sp.]|uniref:potassium channel family protein n=1 Tax=Allosphingosinicella sp. TaxID=2823234 RepID=UPI002EDB7620